MTQSPDHVYETIRIVNITADHSDVSFELNQPRSPASPSLRRAITLWPVKIGAGQHYDMGKHMGVDYQEARDIIARSPQAHVMKRGGRVAILDWPPKVDMPPIRPPAGETPDIQVVILEGTRPEERRPIGVVVPPPPPPAAAAAPAAEAEPEDEEVTEAAGETEQVSAGPEGDTPNVDWKESRLRAYAKEKGIDVSKCRSKSLVLREIQKAESRT